MAVGRALNSIRANAGFIVDKSSDGIGKVYSNTKNSLNIANKAQSDIAILKNKDRQEAVMKQVSKLEEQNKKLALDGSEKAITKGNANEARIQELNAMRNMGDDEVAQAIASREALVAKHDQEAFDHMKSAPKKAWNYMNATDRIGDDDRLKVAAMRWGTGAAAYMGANAGLRYMSGGGMTYNNQGQRDIAGIPFI